MRHRKNRGKLARSPEHRKAMLNNIVSSLFEQNIIVTTTPKAKEARKLAEKFITIAKKDDGVNARRRISKSIQSRKIMKKLFDEIVPLYKDRNGGYTRVVRIGNRRGDGSSLSVLELVEKPSSGEKESE
ncbi:MAG: 50S ribosomal protein L17 [bacterium]